MCGAKGPLCTDGEACQAGADCASTVCQSDMCVPASCGDGVKDGSETDVDCGGSQCGGCGTGKTCAVAKDCTSDVCKGDVCQAPTPHDGVKNDSETSIDCGGGLLANGKKNPASDGAPVCAVGKSCIIGSDCAESVCASGPVLVDNLDGGADAKTSGSDAGGESLTCQAATSHDGAKNDSETDVDCGGALLANGQKNPMSDSAPPCAAQKACAIASDCQSGVCTGSVCQGPTASDMVKNDSETDVDCGGGLLANGKTNPASDGAPACPSTKNCVLGTDCANLVCASAPVGTMGSTNGEPINCPSGQTCTCQPAMDTDGVKNDSETDIDCGGALVSGGGTNSLSDGAPVCQFQTSQGCLIGLDCNSLVCNDNGGMGGGPDDCPAGSKCVCQPPAPNDGVQNGGETDIDCGGGTSAGSDGARACAPGKMCSLGADCASFICSTSNVCTTPAPNDGVQNGGETDVDCGGAPPAPPACTPSATSDCAPPCADNLMCGADTDCLSSYCTVIVQAGATAHVCVDGQSCKGLIAPAKIMDISQEASTDVGGTDALGVPNANGAGQSAGIDTCGAGESTDAPGNQMHESCCKSLLVPNLGTCSSNQACPAGETCSSTTSAMGTCQLRMDKYEVTTGRVRQFIESVKQAEGGYDLQAWIKAQFNATFAMGVTSVGDALITMIPVSGTTNVVTLFPTGDFDLTNPIPQYLSVVAQLGATTLDEGYPSDAQGCYVQKGPAPMTDGAFGASTYWWSSTELAQVVGSPPRPFTQDYYDIKPQNCTPYWIAAAFCAWDGGRLMTQAESNVVYGVTNAANNYNPWGPGSATVPPVLWNGQAPGGLITQANAAGYAITNYTVDFHNANLGASGSQGEFYFYPSWIDSNPNTGPLMTPIIDTLSFGLDATPYIAAPGRFTVDLTTARALAGPGGVGLGEGWMDYGANMLEYLQAASLTPSGGDANYCDTTAQPAPAPPCAAPYNCSRTNISSGNQDCGIIRSTDMPPVNWEGGSWEGHGIQPGGYGEPMQTQYGKAGFRCVRPAEPTP